MAKKRTVATYPNQDDIQDVLACAQRARAGHDTCKAVKDYLKGFASRLHAGFDFRAEAQQLLEDVFKFQSPSNAMVSRLVEQLKAHSKKLPIPREPVSTEFCMQLVKVLDFKNAEIIHIDDRVVDVEVTFTLDGEAQAATLSWKVA